MILDIQRGEVIILALIKIDKGIQEIIIKSIKLITMGKGTDQKVQIKWEIHRKNK